MRVIIKHLLSVALYYTGILYLWDRWRYRRLPHGRPVILMYHRVLPTDDENTFAVPGLIVSAKSFTLQLEHLRRRYHVIPLLELSKSIESRRRSPFRTIVVTFDDGWRDNYDHAFAPLRDLQIPATIFVSTGFVESPKSLWFHLVPALLRRGRLTATSCRQAFDECGLTDSSLVGKLVDSLEDSTRFMARLKEIPGPLLRSIVEYWRNTAADGLAGLSGADCMITWEHIREMHNHGISIGSHTESHDILTLLSDVELDHQLRQSKRVLEENLGDRIVALAYPNGDFDERVKLATSAAGYEVACAVAGSDADFGAAGELFALPRTGIHEGACKGFTGRFSKAIFACLLSGLWHRRGRTKHTPAYD